MFCFNKFFFEIKLTWNRALLFKFAKVLFFLNFLLLVGLKLFCIVGNSLFNGSSHVYLFAIVVFYRFNVNTSFCTFCLNIGLRNFHIYTGLRIIHIYRLTQRFNRTFTALNNGGISKAHFVCLVIADLVLIVLLIQLWNIPHFLLDYQGSWRFYFWIKALDRIIISVFIVLRLYGRHIWGHFKYELVRFNFDLLELIFFWKLEFSLQ